MIISCLLQSALIFSHLMYFYVHNYFFYNMTFDWLQYIPLITFSTFGQLEDLKVFHRQ